MSNEKVTKTQENENAEREEQMRNVDFADDDEDFENNARDYDDVSQFQADDTEFEEIDENIETIKKESIVLKQTIARLTYDSVVNEFLNDGNEDNEVLISDSSGMLSEEISMSSFSQDLSPTFLLDIEEFPRLSAISLTETKQSILEAKRKKSQARSTEDLLGSFVDPLTGELQIESDEAEEHEEEEEEGEEEEDVDDWRFDFPEDPELLILYDKDKEEDEIEALLHKDELLDQKDVMKLFLEATEIKVVFVEPPIDYEALERERTLMLMKKAINDYLQGLITRIVDACEYVDVKAIMRENLDKKKLLEEIFDKLQDCKCEQKIQNFLNRKVVEFFRKKKSERVFAEDSVDTVEHEINKCKILTEKVDALLGEESTHKKFVADLIDTLTTCLNELRKSFLNEVYIFETLVKNTFIREKSSDKFKLSLAKDLRLISAKREEIEKTRLIIRNNLHNFAILNQKLQTVDKLGDGLEIGDYERLGTKIYELDKKIEEQNNNLNKMRLRCHANLHMLTHMKEKVNMMRSSLQLQRDLLLKYYEKKTYVRETLWVLKINHEHIRSKVNEYSIQGGLVNKPDLMLDYDTTLTRISTLQTRVDKSKSKLDEITRKIEVLRNNDCQI